MVETNYKIRTGRTEIEVPHKTGTVTFISPAEGSNTYKSVGKGILSKRLIIPSAEQTASLLHATYCGPKDFVNNSQIKNVKDIMKNRWLWVFNRQLWTPDGLYVVSDPKAKGLSEKLSSVQLEKRLKGARELSYGGVRISKNNSVRFAPVGSYSFGEQNDLSKQGDVIANYGEEDSKKLAEVASKFKYSPRTFGVSVNKGGKPIQRVASLYSGVGGLYVYGYYWGGNGYGYAFGVLR